MTKKSKYPVAQNPLIIHAARLMEAFSKSNDERDFYLDKVEGFILYADLDKTQEQLEALTKELEEHPDRYCAVPKLTFYETKKIMENFVNEKVYDIDTKEKLLDIIQSKEARENFLELIYDLESELEKWHQFYQERFRIRMIEWLRSYEVRFVFEEDLDLTKNSLEKTKEYLFETKIPKDVVAARKVIESKAKTYYSSDALNPRPKRGRPPKQQQKEKIEHQMSDDIFVTVPSSIRTFLFTPEINSMAQVTFSAKFETEEELRANIRNQSRLNEDPRLASLNQKIEELRRLAGQDKVLDQIPDVAPGLLSINDEEHAIVRKSSAKKKKKSLVEAAEKEKPAKKSAAKKPLVVKKTATKGKTAKAAKGKKDD